MTRITQPGHGGGKVSDKLRHLHADISEKVNEINSLLDGGVLMGNDDLDEAIAELNRLRAALAAPGETKEAQPRERKG